MSLYDVHDTSNRYKLLTKRQKLKIKDIQLKLFILRENIFL